KMEVHDTCAMIEYTSLVLSYHTSNRIGLISAKSLVELLDLFDNCDKLELVKTTFPSCFPKQCHSLDSSAFDLHDIDALLLNCIIVSAYHLQISAVELHQLPLIFLLRDLVILL
ncbi:hypothetical protein Tco_1411398, partial [Tanacetum coccineum]